MADGKQMSGLNRFQKEYPEVPDYIPTFAKHLLHKCLKEKILGRLENLLYTMLSVAGRYSSEGSTNEAMGVNLHGSSFELKEYLE